ncbi:MAG: oxygen-insensitive NAD(P)H nitroreductase [Pseudomonas sp.]|jgi:nitroreductase/dihydropteridine reductase|nr:oxygen-insensitive NAD(P)H nitroreductase [Pseudomonas sp.]MDD2224022.1 oxygen-insensitive NAD(P)H nitroreductase [Pseudomonas sp.]MDY0414035.1 oxygen-insensitive NAD(P)H nitroreductase [Pseudomonas sp.]NLO55246.1 oxygen-insensitive NAD(P)H nitroreductase [Gammaproteobacteria bacterium]
MQLTDALTRRYATKAFDPSKTLPEAVVEQLLALLRLSPSSTNIQPWHFIVASSAEGKARLAKGAAGSYSYNQSKILNASHVVLFCARTQIDDAHLQKVLAAEERDGRFTTAPEIKTAAHNTRVNYLKEHIYAKKDVPHWLEKQLYLNMGSFLLGAGLLGIDAVPMEGIDPMILDAEFALNERDLTAVAAVALGYRAETDFNAKLPKSRLGAEDIFTLM